MTGALLGTFAGDALGAPYEGASPGDGRERLEASLRRRELAYTDDTQLALALAEHLVDDPEVRDLQGLADRFLARYERWRGYGAGMHALVATWRRGVPVEEAATAVFPDGSFGNGAAMRVAPVGVRWADDPDRCDAVARRQARVTHAHPLGQDGAAVQARAVANAVRAGHFGDAELVDAFAVAQEPAFRDAARAAREGDLVPDVTAQGAVPAALRVAAEAADLEDGVVAALGLGGDVDTVTAMVGAVLGAAAGGVPGSWVERMEDGPRGRTHAVELARRLAGEDGA